MPRRAALAVVICVACGGPASTKSADPCSYATCTDGAPYDAGDAGAKLCSSAADCAGGACAASIDAQGFPMPPLVCKPNDGAPYDGCAGGVSCTDSRYTCLESGLGQKVCARCCAPGAGVCGSAASGAMCLPVGDGSATCNGALPGACALP